MDHARERQKEINVERLEYKEVAEVGSVLYFCIVDMVTINWMYNSSLKQFMGLFVSSMTDSRQELGEGEQREQETSERVIEIIDALKRIV